MQSPAKQPIAFILQVFKWIKRQLWSFIVAYMIGMHNFYHGDEKDTDTIGIKTEQNELPGDDVPR